MGINMPTSYEFSISLNGIKGKIVRYGHKTNVTKPCEHIHYANDKIIGDNEIITVHGDEYGKHKMNRLKEET